MFLTGEFSKIARVSKRLLQYYDEIGLLKPALTDSKTGYRYYSAKQLPRLNRILALKELGLSLNQISRFLQDDVSDDEIRGMLLMQQAELEKQMLDDLERFRRINSRLKRDDIPDVILKSVPQQAYFATRLQIRDAVHGWENIQNMMHLLPAKLGKANMGHFMVIIHTDEFIFENVDVDFGFLLKNKDVADMEIKELAFSSLMLPEQESVASIIHIGGPNISSIGYGALGQWIESNGYEIIGNQREIFINMHEQPKEEDLVMEIQFPVQKRQADTTLLTNLFD